MTPEQKPDSQAEIEAYKAQIEQYKRIVGSYERLVAAYEEIIVELGGAIPEHLKDILNGR